jgi:hypothetical protein
LSCVACALAEAPIIGQIKANVIAHRRAAFILFLLCALL